jgi:hypothetical protein
MSFLERWNSVRGDTAEGIPWIEHGIRDYRATGTVLGVPGQLARKAEALYLADRTPEALETISEAEALAERFEQRHCYAELHRLRVNHGQVLWKLQTTLQLFILANS